MKNDNIQKLKEDLISSKEIDKYQILYQLVRKEKVSYQQFRWLLEWLNKNYPDNYIN